MGVNVVATRAVTDAALTVEPYPVNGDDVLVYVTVASMHGEALPRPLTFYAPVGLDTQKVEPHFVVCDVHPSGAAWECDDDDRLIYRFPDGEAVTLDDGVVEDVKALVSDFVWQALTEAADAHRAALKARGLAR